MHSFKIRKDEVEERVCEVSINGKQYYADNEVDDCVLCETVITVEIFHWSTGKRRYRKGSDLK